MRLPLKIKRNIGDSFLRAAIKDLESLFKGDRSGIFYVRQLQVKFEKQYFHWVTARAILDLFQRKIIKRLPFPNPPAGPIHFYTHYSNRRGLRQVKEIAKVIIDYSQDHITRSAGSHAENLFGVAFAMNDFSIVGRHASNYRGRQWTQTQENLDYILLKDDIAYGCEIKNTLEYIQKKKLISKISMCKFLDLRPLFVMRYSPKTYNYLIERSGGFALLFKTQVYEINQGELANRMRKIGMPAIVSTSIPDGITKNLMDFHTKLVNLGQN